MGKEMVRDAEILDLLGQYVRVVARLPAGNPYGEMDNVLDGRDIIEEHKALLSPADLRRLEVADEHLRRHGKEVHELVDVDYRKNRSTPQEYWWWFVGEPAGRLQ